MRQAILALSTAVVLTGAIAGISARLASALPPEVARIAVHTVRLDDALDLLNGVIAPVLLAMALASQIALFASIRLGITLSALTLVLGGWQVAAIDADVAPRSAASGPLVHVLTLNAYHDNPEPWRLRGIVERSGADIVLIEEGDGRAAREIARTLPAFHRLVDCATPPCPLTILSRWPVRRLATPMPTAKKLPNILVAEAALPGGPIDVVALHLPRSYFPQARLFRALVTEALNHLAAPAIVAGDFNLPTGSSALAEMAHKTGLLRADTWIATFPANTPMPPFAPIDHMLVDRRLGVHDCAPLPFAGSDHRGIRCEVILPDGGSVPSQRTLTE